MATQLAALFGNSALSESITGVYVGLIERFHVILQVISSGHEINIEKFHEFNLQSAGKYVELYP